MNVRDALPTPRGTLMTQLRHPLLPGAFPIPAYYYLDGTNNVDLFYLSERREKALHEALVHILGQHAYE